MLTRLVGGGSKIGDPFLEWSRDRFPPEFAEVFYNFLTRHLKYLPAEEKRPPELDAQ